MNKGKWSSKSSPVTLARSSDASFGRALWSGRHTQLLHLAQGVGVGPALRYLALLKALELEEVVPLLTAGTVASTLR